MTGVGVAVGVMLALSAGATVLRLVLGPSLIDRLVAMDMLLAVIAGSLAVLAAVTRTSTTFPVLLVVSMLGFVGSVTVARLLAAERDPGAAGDGAAGDGPAGDGPAGAGAAGAGAAGDGREADGPGTGTAAGGGGDRVTP